MRKPPSTRMRTSRAQVPGLHDTVTTVVTLDLARNPPGPWPRPAWRIEHDRIVAAQLPASRAGYGTGRGRRSGAVSALASRAPPRRAPQPPPRRVCSSTSRPGRRLRARRRRCRDRRRGERCASPDASPPAPEHPAAASAAREAPIDCAWRQAARARLRAVTTGSARRMTVSPSMVMRTIPSSSALAASALTCRGDERPPLIAASRPLSASVTMIFNSPPAAEEQRQHRLQPRQDRRSNAGRDERAGVDIDDVVGAPGVKSESNV